MGASLIIGLSHLDVFIFRYQQKTSWDCIALLSSRLSERDGASSRPSAVTNGSNNGAGSVVAGKSSCASVNWNWVRKNDGNENSNVFRCVR